MCVLSFGIKNCFFYIKFYYLYPISINKRNNYDVFIFSKICWIFNHRCKPRTNKKVEIAGEGGEFVIINRHKYYRHDLMAAFGGTLNPGASPWPKININPAPRVMWVCHDHFCLIPLQCPSYGYQSSKCGSFTCMFLRWCSSIFAGCFEFVTGNTFGMTALTSYGAFWLSYSAILVDSFGVAAAYEASEETASQLPNAIDFSYLLGVSLHLCCG